MAAQRYREARDWSDRQLAVTSRLPDPGDRSGAQWHAANCVIEIANAYNLGVVQASLGPVADESAGFGQLKPFPYPREQLRPHLLF